jgi:hypothetical protein
MPSKRRDEAAAAGGLLLAVLELLQARTTAEARHVIDSNPELLTEAAERLLDMATARFARDGDHPSATSSLAVIDERRELLRRCREVGVERAFAEGSRLDPQRLVGLLTQFADAGSASEAEELVRRHPEIMGDMAQDMLRTFAGNARRAENLQAAAYIDRQRLLLLRCREIGVSRAFAEEQSWNG